MPDDTRDCSEPLATGVQVVDAATGREVADTNSDSKGHYRVPLPPGKYRISLVDAAGLDTPVEVAVSSDRYAEADVLVDSGVR